MRMNRALNMNEPELRFPEFLKKSGWKELVLSRILFEHGLKSTGKEEVFSVSVHKGLINQIEHLGRSFSAANTDHYNLVLPGDIVYTKSPTGDFPYGIIKQSRLTKQVIVSPLYGVFTPKTFAIGYILDTYFSSPANTNNYLSPIIQKGAKNTININNDTFLSKGILLPESKEEQEKLADFLSTIDDVISSENQKLEALRAHKKGLMQQLFPSSEEIFK
jgi:type I restriction enzyme, S subunit